MAPMKLTSKILFLLIFLLEFTMTSFAQRNTFQVYGGIAQMNITPPVGGRLAGHFYEIFSTGIHDSLWAKAVEICLCFL
jgi:neutral ceramidase